MNVSKHRLVIAQDLLDAADGTSHLEKAALLTQAAQVHVLIEMVKELKAVHEELVSLQRALESAPSV
jgi:hypothetical protein